MYHKAQIITPCPCRKHHADYHCSWGAGLDESRKILKRMLKVTKWSSEIIDSTDDSRRSVNLLFYRQQLCITTRNFSTTINNNIHSNKQIAAKSNYNHIFQNAIHLQTEGSIRSMCHSTTKWGGDGRRCLWSGVEKWMDWDHGLEIDSYIIYRTTSSS